MDKILRQKFQTFQIITSLVPNSKAQRVETFQIIFHRDITSTFMRNLVTIGIVGAVESTISLLLTTSTDYHLLATSV